MPVELLPKSAAAFAPRASYVNVVLGTKVELWLTDAEAHQSRQASAQQHTATSQVPPDLLSSKSAIWCLASLMLPERPESDVSKHDLSQLLAYRLIHINAYVVHVDMVPRNEVAFKLTTDSIDALVEFHRDVHCVDEKARSIYWPEKEQQCSKLHEDFIQAINKFVFRTHVSVLEGLEEEGSGELLCGRSHEVKNNLSILMKPLLPPARIAADARRPPPPPLPELAPRDCWVRSDVLAAVEAWKTVPSFGSDMSSMHSIDQSSLLLSGTDLIRCGLVSTSASPAFTQSNAYYSYASVSPAATQNSSLPLPSMLASSLWGSAGAAVSLNWERN